MAVIYKKLGEIADISAGGTPKRSNPTYWKNGNIPWVKISDVKGKYLEKTEEFITEDGLNNSSAKLFKKGTLLYTIFATIGECAILNIDASTNQAIAGINVKSEKVLTEYLYYFLKSIKNTVVNTGRGVAQNNINLSILKNIDVPLPEIEVQKKIINLLNKSNELVIKRKAQIEALDQLTQSVFLEMFGDTVKNPMNWKTYTLDDVYEIIDGDRGKHYPKQSEFYDEGYCLFLNTGNVTKNGFNFNKTQFITKEKDEVLRKGKLKRYDLVLTTRGTVGNIAYYDDNVPYEKIRINSGMVILRKKVNINPMFFTYYFRNPSIYKRLISGTAQPQMPISNLRKAKVYYPPLNLQNDFENLVQKIEVKKELMKKSLEALEDNFNSLLQRAFKGELFTEEKVSNL